MQRTTTAAKLAALAAVGVLFLGACGSDSDGGSDGGGSGNEATTTTAADGGESMATPPGENGGRTEGDGELVIGAVLPQSGNLSFLGPPMIEGAQMAVRDINEAGGVNGKDVKIIVKDDGGGADSDLALTSVDELINNENADLILGAAASGTTKDIIDRVVSSGTAECSPSNTGSDLTTWDDKGLYFRTPPADDLQAQALAKVVSDDGYTSVAIVAQNSDYGTGFVRYLQPALEDGGADIVADVTYELNGTGIDAEVEKVVQAEPDAVVLIGYPEDGGKVLAEMIKQGAGPDKLPIYVTDGMQSNELYQLVDEADPSVTAGIRGTAASAAPEDGASFFPDAFAEFAPDVESPIYSAQSYDCVVLTALAAQAAGSDAPFDIAANMIAISGGEGVADDAEKCNTYADCLALLEDGKSIDYDGASGALDFSEYGEPSAGSYDVYTFQDDGTYATDEQLVIGG
ncbi:MAG: ABC transporter substrate-binding protein [Acidimicrobiales bacterium]|nr:ABC transporter substrate-binding protein [Acidimicrobiales bacterium]HRW36662.1 ABC transporter substrate-binding protein [Aquihabitans sp.]